MKKFIHVKEYSLQFKRIILIITALIILLSFFMVYNTNKLNAYNQKSMELSKLYMRYTDITTQFTFGSDILTEQVRIFAETGNVEYIYGYFNEAKVDMHRDTAIRELEEIVSDTNMQAIIEQSMQESINLMNREYYSMKLAAYGYNIPDTEIPFKEISSVVLSEEDLALSPEEAKSKARHMLFDEVYSGSKHKIKTGVGDFLNKTLSDSETEYDKLTRTIDYYSNLQRILIEFAFALFMLRMCFLYFFVVHPIVEASKKIKNNLPIKMPAFLSEMRELGFAYNNLRDKNEELVGRLKVFAERDSLTGIGNRLAYDTYTGLLKKRGGKVLMFVFDVNRLRETNNEKGHAAGDKLLSNAASCIVRVFGNVSGDNCFRIGGDEFVAYVEGKTYEDAQKYIDAFDEECNDGNVSVSVGYSYAENISAVSEQKMFSTADERMYKKKDIMHNETSDNKK